MNIKRLITLTVSCCLHQLTTFFFLINLSQAIDKNKQTNKKIKVDFCNLISTHDGKLNRTKTSRFYLEWLLLSL